MICHAKKKHLPVVFVQFVRRVGVWPRALVSDGAGEIMETKLQRQLLARSCKHYKKVAARGAHPENGPAERSGDSVVKIRQRKIRQRQRSGRWAPSSVLGFTET